MVQRGRLLGDYTGATGMRLQLPCMLGRSVGRRTGKTRGERARQRVSRGSQWGEREDANMMS
jgi:hypothetical protein